MSDPLRDPEAAALAVLPSEPPGLTLAEWAEAAGASPRQLRRWLPRIRDAARIGGVAVPVHPTANGWRYRLTAEDAPDTWRWQLRGYRRIGRQTRTVEAVLRAWLDGVEARGEDDPEIRAALEEVSGVRAEAARLRVAAYVGLADAMAREGEWSRGNDNEETP